MDQRLTDAEREEVNETAGRMSQPPLVGYLVREVDGLIDTARAGPPRD